MKRFIIITFLLISVKMLSAQGISLVEGQPALVYSLPKTRLCIEVEVEKTTQKPGLYYQYSERYLATNQVILEEKTTYSLKTIVVKPVAIPDSKRTFIIQSPKNNYLSQISVNELGILCGINVPCHSSNNVQVTKTVSTQKKQAANMLLPLSEEYLMAGSNAKLAEGAAKQIYRIRESRMSLLTGDLDHLPSDGKSLSTMLDGLNKMERELTELFIGKTTTEVQKQTFCLAPDSALNNKVVFRLSAIKGLVSADDLTGNPYFINIQPEKISTTSPDPKSKKAKIAINTILPANTTITITDGVKTYYSDKLMMPQFGVVLPMGEEMFGYPKLKVYIDSQTGRLLCIEK